MSKNLTRKGLALGAIVALGSSLFAGAPAFAGVTTAGITLAPTAGTTYTSIAGSAFSLTNTIDNSITTSSKTARKLTYLISNTAGASFQVSYKGGNSTAGLNNVRSGDAADTISTSLDTTDATKKFTSKFVAVTGTSLLTNQAVDSSSTYTNKLVITTSTDATENVVLTVTPFIDEDLDGQIDEFDLVGAVKTVTWIPAASVTATTSIISAVTGASTITGKVVLGNDINMANLGTDVKIGFKKDGVVVPIGAAASGTVTVDSTDVSYDATEAGLVNFFKRVLKSADGAADVVKVGTYVAQAYYKVTGAALGSASNAANPANGYTKTVDSTDSIETVATANVYLSTKGALANAVKVRAGYTGEIAFTSGVSYNSSDASVALAAGAGVTVRVTLTRTTLDAASTFAAGGKTLTATSAAQTFTTVTDADGAIAFTASGTGKSGDAVEIKVEALKADGTYDADSSTTTVTYETAVATTLVNTDLAGSGAVLKTTKGGSYTLNYVVLDQFKQPFASTSTYQVRLEPSTGASFLYLAPVTAGKASQVIVDNSTAAGTYSITAKLEKLNTTSNTWTQNVLSASALNVYVNAVVPAALTATAKSTSAVATITKTLVTADLRADNSTKTATTIGYGTATQAVSGVVTDATGVAVAGAPVTVTAAGLAFVVNGNVYSVGSATVNADANGAYSVDVYSTTAGKTSVVVASGAATKTVAIEFSGITTVASTNVITIDAPALSQVGRSVTVTVKIVDKFGNPVVGATPVVSVTGVGSVTTAAATAKTGLTTVQFVAGANDFGDAVITAKIDATDATAAALSATKTLTVGYTDAQIDVVGKRVTAVASFSKGKTVAFYVDGVKKWSKLSASDADVVLNYNLKKGRHTVTVKISGGFVTTDVIVVK